MRVYEFRHATPSNNQPKDHKLERVCDFSHAFGPVLLAQRVLALYYSPPRKTPFYPTWVLRRFPDPFHPTFRGTPHESLHIMKKQLIAKLAIIALGAAAGAAPAPVGAGGG